MADYFSHPLWCATLEFADGRREQMAPGMPHFWQPGRRSAVLADEVRHHLQNPPLNFIELLSFSLVEEPVGHRVKVNLEPPRPDPRLSPVEVELQLFAWPLAGGGWFGVVPAWNVECSAASEKALLKQVEQELVLLAPRQYRWRDPVRVVELLKVKHVELQPHRMELDYDRQSEEKQEDLLKAVTAPMPEARFSSGGKAKPEIRVFGLDESLRQLRQVLDKRAPQSVLIVGPSGSGKTALVRAFANEPAVTVREADGGELLMRLMGDSGWQQPMHRLLEQLLEPGAPMLFVRNLAKLFEVGRYIGNRTSLAEFMVPYLNRGLTLISECTPEQRALLEARYPGVLNALFPLELPEHAPAMLDGIVRRKAEVLGKRDKVLFETGAIEAVMKLHRRFSPYSGMPGRPLRFVETLLRRLDRQGDQDRASLSMADMYRAFSEVSGIPLSLLDPEVPLPANDIEAFFHRRVFAQNQVCATLVRTLSAIKAGMTRPGKPVASYLFIGPTGVGKTEMCKALAEFMFGDQARITRFDMSEYQDAHALVRLCGLPGEDGILTGAVRQQPFGVILLDEVEKAHPDFFDLLLPMLGEGRLTDGHGRVADFCSSIVVMTSNLGAEAQPGRGQGFADGPDDKELRAHYHEVVRRHLRPEMFNRLDEILYFRPLGREVMEKLIDKELHQLSRCPGFKQSRPSVAIDQALRDRLVQAGYDPRYGARQLKRAMRELVSVPVSAAILSRCSETSRVASATVEPANNSSRQATVKLELKAAEKDRAGWESLEKMVSQYRWGLVAMMDAHAWFKLLSWIDEEREQRRKRIRAYRVADKDVFVEHSARYRHLVAIRDELNAYRQRIFKLEENMLEALILGEESTLDENNFDQLEFRAIVWAKAWLDIRNRIYFTIAEIREETTVGLYCSRAHQSDLLELYLEKYEKCIAELKLECQVMAVSEEAGRVVRKPFERAALDENSLGVEFQFNDPMAYVYFQAEHGSHLAITGQFGADRKRSYLWIDVSNAPPGSALPAGVQRWGYTRRETHAVRKIEDGMFKIKYGSGTTNKAFDSLELELAEVLKRYPEKKSFARLNLAELLKEQAEKTIVGTLWY